MLVCCIGYPLKSLPNAHSIIEYWVQLHSRSHTISARWGLTGSRHDTFPTEIQLESCRSEARCTLMWARASVRMLFTSWYAGHDFVHMLHTSAASAAAIECRNCVYFMRNICGVLFLSLQIRVCWCVIMGGCGVESGQEIILSTRAFF